jgi:S1-C subfamily serine protease
VIDEELAASVGGDLSHLDRFPRVELAVDRYAISDGFNRERVLLLQGDELRELADDGITVANTRKLPNRYEFIEERRDAYIAVTQNPEPVLHVVDKGSLKVRREIRLTADEAQVLEITDLAISPNDTMSYVAIKSAVELPRYTVLTVDEQSGRVQVPGILGTWVEVSPDGKRLYTGYKDLYDRGSRFHINPDWRLIEIPEYGNVDMLMSWSVGSRPRLRQVMRQAGGNGTGIRLSSDGQRITYLSVVGTPLHSKNLQGWNAKDLGDPPVTYETKDRAVTTELAFHPSLPLVAVPGNRAAVLFDRETGRQLENKLLIPADGLGDVQVERLFFSPNGRNLVCVCSAGAAGRYLRCVQLKLTSQELARRGERQPDTRKASESPAKTVPRQQLGALNPRETSEPLTAREIGKQYLDGVVSILTDDSSGTGFFIGSTGYLLTSAHVVDGADSIEVVHNSKPGATDYAPLKVPAEVIRIDDTLDLALLKIESTVPLIHVYLASDERVETGESVTVIGDPGLGNEVLNRTMTAGIVSNPSRELGGQQFVQISAAINPGNSGGPLFNEHGLVIGLISLKGNIEGAGFAVPASVLRKFLQQAMDEK